MIYFTLPSFYFNFNIINKVMSLDKKYYKFPVAFEAATGNFPYCYFNGGYNNNQGLGALYNDFEGKLYAFSLRGNGIFLSDDSYRFISKYKMEIEKLNYYAWARFLEKVNDDDALIRVLEKLDMATPQRKDLSMYRDILFNEFQEDRCFYCGKKLDKNVHVDHFIPWTFVKNDNLWNFVLACPKCNIRKSGSLVSRDYIIKIGHRNASVVEGAITNPTVRVEFDGYYHNPIQ